MGAWSHTSFGNDKALDFLAEVEANGVGEIERAVRSIEAIKKGKDIDSREACAVIAAGELLAVANGKPPRGYFPENVREIAAALKPDAVLCRRALTAIERVLSDRKSELRELWEESESGADWQADVRNLLERLK